MIIIRVGSLSKLLLMEIFLHLHDVAVHLSDACQRWIQDFPNGNAWPHGCSKGEGAMEAFAMCA